MNLLIVEDDVRLASALAHILEEAGHAVDTANDGETGYAYASQGKYDVAILDVMLPKKNGFDIVSDLRRAGIATPVLMLTARDAVPDKIRGLDSGADDYMTKPFSPAELMAHLRALTRRQGEVEFETLRAFNLTLDLTEREFASESSSIHLSAKEFALARVLMSNAGKTVPKATIIDRVWGTTSVTEDNNVEAYVSFLRKKLRFLEANAHIETIRGVGYRLAEGRRERQPCALQTAKEIYRTEYGVRFGCNYGLVHRDLHFRLETRRRRSSTSHRQFPRQCN